MNWFSIQSKIQLRSTSPSFELMIARVYALISDRKILSDDFSRGPWEDLALPSHLSKGVLEDLLNQRSVGTSVRLS